MRKDRKTHKAIVLTVAIPERLNQQAASFLCGDIVHDPAFWTIVYLQPAFLDFLVSLGQTWRVLPLPLGFGCGVPGLSGSG